MFSLSSFFILYQNSNRSFNLLLLFSHSIFVSSLKSFKSYFAFVSLPFQSVVRLLECSTRLPSRTVIELVSASLVLIKTRFDLIARVLTSRFGTWPTFALDPLSLLKLLKTYSFTLALLSLFLSSDRFPGFRFSSSVVFFCARQDNETVWNIIWKQANTCFKPNRYSCPSFFFLFLFLKKQLKVWSLCISLLFKNTTSGQLSVNHTSFAFLPFFLSLSLCTDFDLNLVFVHPDQIRIDPLLPYKMLFLFVCLSPSPSWLLFNSLRSLARPLNFTYICTCWPDVCRSFFLTKINFDVNLN